MIIHKASFTNFQVFSGGAEISFVIDKNNESLCDGFSSQAVDGLSISPVIVIAGGRSSSVSSVKPLLFLAAFISGCLSTTSKGGINCDSISMIDSGTAFMEFEFEKKLYRYVLELRGGEIFFESLHVKSSKCFSCVFVRRQSDSKLYDDVRIGNSENIENFKSHKKQLRSIPKRVSVIAAAEHCGSPLARRMVFQFSNLAASGDMLRSHDVLPADVLVAADSFSNSDILRKQMVSLLAMLDPNLQDIQIKAIKYFVNSDNEKKLHIPCSVRKIKAVNDETCVNPLWAESRTMLAAFVQLSRLLPVLLHGGVAIVGEADALGCSDFLKHVVGLFMRKETNPCGAQILLITNSLDVLKYVHISNVYMPV